MKRRSLSYVIALVCMLAAPSAHARDELPQLTDYNALLRELRADGIEASDIRWGEIEKLCVAKRNPNAPTVYNTCRYEKALDQVQFVIHAATCDDQSLILYPIA